MRGRDAPQCVGADARGVVAASEDLVEVDLRWLSDRPFRLALMFVLSTTAALAVHAVKATLVMNAGVGLTSVECS
jgi:hypothetical protein